MNREEIITRIREIISQETDIPLCDIRETSLLMRELQLSSLEILTILGKLEEKYNLHTNMNELPNVTTPGEIADYIISSAMKE